MGALQQLNDYLNGIDQAIRNVQQFSEPTFKNTAHILSAMNMQMAVNVGCFVLLLLVIMWQGSAIGRLERKLDRIEGILIGKGKPDGQQSNS